jgi:hypothetical protein
MIGGSLAHVEQSAELAEGICGNQRRPQRKLDAFRIAHPARKRKQSAVGRLAEKTYSVAILLSAPNRQGQPGKRMPAIVDRYGLQTVCIM